LTASIDADAFQPEGFGGTKKNAVAAKDFCKAVFMRAGEVERVSRTQKDF
jgi:hypothetical protein